MYLSLRRNIRKVINYLVHHRVGRSPVVESLAFGIYPTCLFIGI